MFVPVMTLNISPPRWGSVPMPLLPKLSPSLLDFASAIRSLTDFTGSDGLTTMSCGAAPISDTGVKSRSDW